MDSGADQATEDYAILGKRKRDGDQYDIYSAPAESAEHLNREAPSSVLGINPKRLRRPSETASNNDGSVTVRGSNKIAALNTLPVEILQSVLRLLDPFSLRHLMCVSRRLRVLLDPREAQPSPSGMCKTLPLLSQDSIWKSSRQRFLTSIPEPLPLLSELDMLQLVFGSRCQFCKRQPSRRSVTASKSHWNAGPGPEGVRTIWPFKVRSCADCLQSRLIKEEDLILLPASVLRSGLPFALFSPSLNYIATLSLKQSSLPPGLKVRKYHFRPQVEELEMQMRQVQALGPAVSAQWFRGLEPILEEFNTAIVRVERWDLDRQATDQQEVPPDASSISSYSGQSGLLGSSYSRSNYTSTNTSSWHQPGQGWRYGSQRQSFSTASIPAALRNITNGSGRPTITMTPQGTSTDIERSSAAQKHAERSLREATKIKNQRRADIEYRCSRLEPPLLGIDLLDMKSFNAAIQIAKPLDEDAWNLLKTRLLAERRPPDADNRTETDNLSSYVPSRETVISKDIEQHREPSLDVVEQAARPTRDKVVEIAQEYIKRCFMNGTNLTAATAPHFAADVLEHVGVRFYEIQEQEDAALAVLGKAPMGESHSGLRTRHLQLRHMRHVVDSCILPCTQMVETDLFMCSGCEPSEKLFPFLGLIQHYAAKHTESFSSGSRVVHWASEWPTVLPFRKLSVPSTATANPLQLSDNAIHRLSESPVQHIRDIESSERYDRFNQPYDAVQSQDSSTRMMSSRVQQLVSEYAGDSASGSETEQALTIPNPDRSKPGSQSDGHSHSLIMSEAQNPTNQVESFLRRFEEDHVAQDVESPSFAASTYARPISQSYQPTFQRHPVPQRASDSTYQIQPEQREFVDTNSPQTRVFSHVRNSPQYPDSPLHQQSRRSQSYHRQALHEHEMYTLHGHPYTSSPQSLTTYNRLSHYPQVERRSHEALRQVITYYSDAPPDHIQSTMQRYEQYDGQGAARMYSSHEHSHSEPDVFHDPDSRVRYARERRYIPINNQHDVERAHERHSDYYHDDHHYQRSLAPGTHPPEERRWNYHQQ